MLKVLPLVIYIFLAHLKSTLRIEHINKSPISEAWAKGTNFIVCFWHGRLLMMLFAKEGGTGKVLISRHRDGELFARVIHSFKLGTIRGSYRKGSISSLREIIHDLEGGIDVGITPDGPKGPRYKVKKGIIELARLSGKAIIPVSYSAGKKKLFIHGTISSFPTLFQKSFFFGETLSLFTAI
jgi:hypothetical protein